MVAQAELWPLPSLGRELRAGPVAPMLAEWPLPRPADWPTIQRAAERIRNRGAVPMRESRLSVWRRGGD